MSSYSISACSLSGPFQALRMNIYPSTVTDLLSTKKTKTVLQKVICYSKRITFDAVWFSLYQLYVYILNPQMGSQSLDASISTLKLHIINTCKQSWRDCSEVGNTYFYDTPEAGPWRKCSPGGPWWVRDRYSRQTTLIGGKEVREEKVTTQWPRGGGGDAKPGRKPKRERDTWERGGRRRGRSRWSSIF